jgi:hypothetical protein
MSDITLDDWLMEVLRSETGKGIKLDFKSTRVVEPAFRVLARLVGVCWHMIFPKLIPQSSPQALGLHQTASHPECRCFAG